MFNDIKRVTVEEVLDAYEKTGLKPLQGFYFGLTEDTQNCACALAAIYQNEVGSKGTASKVEKYIYQEKNIESDYLIGFIYGFDNHKNRCLSDYFKEDWSDLSADRASVFSCGFYDGTETRKVVFGELS